MSETIEIGDEVSVSFNSQAWTLVNSGIVLYKPNVPGDSWHIKDKKTGTIHYISEGCTITKYPK